MNKKIIIIIAAFLIIFPIFVSAYTLLQPLPGGGQILEKDVTLSQYLSWLFRFALVAGAFLAVLKIVIGGMHIMVSGASESSQSKGREMIEMALWGVLLAISSVLILTAINPDLIKTGLTVPDIKAKNIVPYNERRETRKDPNQYGEYFHVTEGKSVKEVRQECLNYCNSVKVEGEVIKRVCPRAKGGSLICKIHIKRNNEK